MPRLFTDPPDGWSGWADRLRRVLGECAAADGPLPEAWPLADALLSRLHRVAADAADCGWPLLADGLCDVETVGDLNTLLHVFYTEHHDHEDRPVYRRYVHDWYVPAVPGRWLPGGDPGLTRAADAYRREPVAGRLRDLARVYDAAGDTRGVFLHRLLATPAWGERSFRGPPLYGCGHCDLGWLREHRFTVDREPGRGAADVGWYNAVLADGTPLVGLASTDRHAPPRFTWESFHCQDVYHVYADVETAVRRVYRDRLLARPSPPWLAWQVAEGLRADRVAATYGDALRAAWRDDPRDPPALMAFLWRGPPAKSGGARPLTELLYEQLPAAWRDAGVRLVEDRLADVKARVGAPARYDD